MYFTITNTEVQNADKVFVFITEFTGYLMLWWVFSFLVFHVECTCKGLSGFDTIIKIVFLCLGENQSSQNASSSPKSGSEGELLKVGRNQPVSCCPVISDLNVPSYVKGYDNIFLFWLLGKNL